MRLRPAIPLLCSALAAFATPPAMFRGNAAHTGVYASPAPTLATVAWTFRSKGRILSSPVVSEGRVYVGSADHRVYALDAADGRLQWSFTTLGAVNASPAVAQGLVIVGSLDGSIYALDALDGKPRWTFRTGGERRYSAPGIHGAIPRTEVMPDPFDVFLSSPVVEGNRVFVGSGDHHVYALDLGTGALLWKFKTGNVVHASPAVADGTVFIGSWDRNLYALDAKTGAQRWSHDNHKGWVIASPAVLGGRVYFPTSDGRRFKALDTRTGAVAFDLENRAISFSSPALAGGTAYFGSSDGWLHAVDLSIGKARGAFQTEGNRENGSRYLDDKGAFNHAAMYPAHTLEGMFIGMDRMFSLGAVLSSPAISEGVLYVGSADGRLYALK